MHRIWPPRLIHIVLRIRVVLGAHLRQVEQLD